MEQGPKLLPLAMLTEHYEKLRASVPRHKTVAWLCVWGRGR